MKTSFNIDEIMATKPCYRYDRKIIKDLMCDNKTVSIIDICDWKISIYDKCWFFINGVCQDIKELQQIIINITKILKKTTPNFLCYKKYILSEIDYFIKSSYKYPSIVINNDAYRCIFGLLSYTTDIANDEILLYLKSI